MSYREPDCFFVTLSLPLWHHNYHVLTKWRDPNTCKVQKNAYLLWHRQTHNLQIFGVIPFVKLQNDTSTTVHATFWGNPHFSWTQSERKWKWLAESFCSFEGTTSAAQTAWHGKSGYLSIAHYQCIPVSVFRWHRTQWKTAESGLMLSWKTNFTFLRN